MIYYIFGKNVNDNKINLIIVKLFFSNSGCFGLCWDKIFLFIWIIDNIVIKYVNEI